MRLTPEQNRALQAAIINAFTKKDLEKVTKINFGNRLEEFTDDDGTIRDTVFDLVDHFERDGRLAELIRCLLDERPKNAALKQICDHISSSNSKATTPALPSNERTAEPTPDAHSNASKSGKQLADRLQQDLNDRKLVALLGALVQAVENRDNPDATEYLGALFITACLMLALGWIALLILWNSLPGLKYSHPVSFTFCRIW